MRIGELARRAGVHVQTLRYYEREGLLREPGRSFSGYRSYDTTDLERVEFIRKTQTWGFSLKEIKELLELHKAVLHCPGSSEGPSSEIQGIVRMFAEKQQRIATEIAQLQCLERQLRRGLDDLQLPAPLCPVSPSTPGKR